MAYLAKSCPKRLYTGPLQCAGHADAAPKKYLPKRTGTDALPGGHGGLATQPGPRPGQLGVHVQLAGEAVALALLAQLGDRRHSGLLDLCLLLQALRLHLLRIPLLLPLLSPAAHIHIILKVSMLTVSTSGEHSSSGGCAAKL